MKGFMNLFQQQHSKVNKPTKGLKSTIKSTAKVALLFTYENIILTGLNTLVDQKYHSTLGSLITEKEPKIQMSYCNHSQNI